eukprot:symbB.v1.2.014710.t1/scaffold1080.1/size139481/6
MAMHLLTPEEAEIARTAQKQLLLWFSLEYESLESALPMFDLDADGFISAFEISRVASQAGVPEHTIPTLIRSLRMGPAGIPLDSLADILLGRGVMVPSAPRELKPPDPPPRPPPPPGGNRLLKIVEEARQRQHNLTTEILGLLQWKEAPEFPVQQREADAISWSLRIGTKELFSITDNFGSTTLMLSCRLGMEQLCYVMLTAPGILPEELKSYVNRRNQMGWTALLLAAQNGFDSICQQLVLSEADPNMSTGGSELTPLMLAASNGHEETTRFLLDFQWSRHPSLRADPFRLSTDGRFALHFVRQRLQRRSLQASLQNLDTYGISRAQLCPAPEEYSNIERMLLYAMQTAPIPPGFREHAQDDEYLGSWQHVLDEPQMGASGSVEPPDADELKRLFDKHDVTGSGNLERQEAYAFIEDLRLRYGMDEELPDSFKDAVFKDFDKDHAETWSWHDVRVLSGDGWHAMRRRLQRVRVRGGQRHNRAQRQKEKTLAESASSAWAKVSGAGATIAALRDVEKVKDLEEEIELDFHPMRIENISIGQEAWTFAPQIDLRVIRGDPRRGRNAPHEVNEAIFKGPFVAQAVSKVPRGSTQDPTWSDSLNVTFTKAHKPWFCTSASSVGFYRQRFARSLS